MRQIYSDAVFVFVSLFCFLFLVVLLFLIYCPVLGTGGAFSCFKHQYCQVVKKHIQVLTFELQRFKTLLSGLLIEYGDYCIQLRCF